MKSIILSTDGLAEDNPKGPPMFSINRKTDRRRRERCPIDISLSILCMDQEGRETPMHARLVDISLSDARLCVPQKIPPHTAVTFYYAKFGIGGRGTVRFCRSARKGYEVGLEFPNGTGWSPALREKVDLLNLTSEISRAEPVPQESHVAVLVPSDTA
jgi:hypothetical protein